ncbi:MAG: 16S rRNA (guanine(527)-N(7))-methyltransferase RsmG [Phyllobacterium sp.]
MLKEIVPNVSRETISDLEAFEILFRKWAKAINLASPSTLDDLWSRHIIDSVQLIPLAQSAKYWVDLGSGGGFPGIVIALFLKSVEGSLISLVESNGKKAAFLRTALGQFSAPGKVYAQRIDAVYELVPKPDIVTARALAPLNELLGLAEPWLVGGAIGLFHKGRDYRREIEESRNAWKFDLVEYPSIVAVDSVILKISNVQRRSSVDLDQCSCS